MPTASSVIADIIEAEKTDGNIKSVFWEDGAQSAAAEKDSVSERYFIRTDCDVSALLLKAEKVSDLAYITNPLNDSEISVLEEKINEHGKLLSKIPVFE